MELIYCVEDDLSIRELIVYTLKLSGFEAEGYNDADEFFDALKNRRPDLIVLDIMLRGKDGLQILKELKNSREYKNIPVIMATAKTSEFDKITGLDMGADDYLSKPFGMMEMVSRIKAVLRRSGNSVASDIVSYKDIEIDKLKRSVKHKETILNLTFKEYELLLLLCENPGIVFSRDQLLEKIWGSDYLGESRTIDVHIGTLRNKLGTAGDDIRTVHGVGYCMKEIENG
ncbi:MAG: response regulator transcription factor [Erysipelotrichaceae bacterium]|nr:response regulator transcription factor [Erysipelotrichaceae bacterium]